MYVILMTHLCICQRPDWGVYSKGGRQVCIASTCLLVNFPEWRGIHILQWLYRISTGVAGDSYPSVVIPDLDRKLAHGLPNLSKQLRARLRNGSSMAGLAHLANHTCCPHHRNSELQILSVCRKIGRAQSCKGPLVKGLGLATRRS